MEKRRPLTDVVNSTDDVQQFVFGNRETQSSEKSRPQKKTPVSERANTHARMHANVATPVALVNLSVRLTQETAAALRQAMLSQKAEGRSPTSTQGIVEEALQYWLQERGFLPRR